MKTKEKKPKSKARNIIEWVLTGIFLVIFAFFALFTIDGMVHQKQNYGLRVSFGYSIATIETNSMSHDNEGNELYPVGSAVFTKKSDFSKLTYKDDVRFWNYLNSSDYSKSGSNQASFLHRIIGYVPSNNKEPITIQFDDGVSYTATYQNPTPYPFYIVMGANVVKPTEENGFQTAGYNNDNNVTHYGAYQVQFVFESDEADNSILTRYKNGASYGSITLPDYENKEASHSYDITGAGVYLGKVIFKSNFLGKAFSFMTSIWGLLILLLIPALYLVVTSILDIFSAMEDEPEKETAAPAPKDSIDPLAGMSEEEKERLKAEMLQEMLDEQEKKGK